MRKLLLGLTIFIVSALATRPVFAENTVNAYFFWGEGCPHCAQEEAFLKELQEEYKDLEIHKFEIYKNRKNALLLQKVGRELGVDVSGVPFLIIGDETFSGFSPTITPQKIETRVEECTLEACPDSVFELAGLGKASSESNEKEPKISSGEHTVDVPILGSVDLDLLSLPTLSILLGFLDGFNPCAMWVLLFLISMLIGMENKKRRWTLGVAFIMASAFVYFIFMAAWLQLILFLGFILWIRVLIGIVALIGGGYSLKEFFTNKEAGCEVTNAEQKQKIFQRIKAIIAENNFWLALAGIVVLAFMVNLVELICSAGLPAIYTQILALNQLPMWKYYAYILLYILFFMLDDLFVFFVSMKTLEMTGVTTKYTRVSRLIGGVLMLIIGLLMIFKPEVLMFG